MYLKNLLNRKDLKMIIPKDYMHSIQVYTYKENEKINNYYFNLSSLYNKLCKDKNLTLFRVDKVNSSITVNLTMNTIKFSFDETKLEISLETKLEYNLKIL